MAGSNIQVPVLVLPTDTLTEGGEIGQRPLPSGESIALIQYTSGSTGNPKGVVITHSNLLHNQQLLQQTFGGHPQSVIFSWLPFHHDMGLIGNILHTIYLGCTCVLMLPIHLFKSPCGGCRVYQNTKRPTVVAPILRTAYAQKISVNRRLHNWTSQPGR